jgi:hypothetical protein
MTKNRKVLIAGGTSLVLMAMTLGAIVMFGYTNVPTFASLKIYPDPSITGTLAYVDEDDNGNSCLHVIHANGDGGEVKHCDVTYYTSPIFTKDGDVVMSSPDPVEYNNTKYEVFDAETLRSKETFSVFRGSGDFLTQAYGDETLFTSGDSYDDYDSGLFHARARAHTVWVARDREGKDRVFSRHAPASYDFISAAHSPDKKWIVVSSSRGDVLISDDKGNVRELVHGHADSGHGGLFGGGVDFGPYSLSSVAWYQTGHTEGTVDVAQLKAGSPAPTSSSDHVSITSVPL